MAAAEGGGWSGMAALKNGKNYWGMEELGVERLGGSHGGFSGGEGGDMDESPMGGGNDGAGGGGGEGEEMEMKGSG